MVSVWPVALFLLIGQAAATFSPNAHAKGHTLEPSSVCSGLRVTPPSDRSWLPLYHRGGPCLPSGIGASNLADILRRDQLRVDLVGRKLSKNKNGSSADVTLGTSLGTLQYVVSVGLGTPAVRQTVLIDTGSDLSWVQCRPCPVPPCHRQKDAVFDPTKSSTYSPVRCGSRACARLGHLYANGCSNSECGYKVSYGDGSNTTGTYSYDTLTMASSAPLLKSFLFGCSHAETGFDDSEDRTDGLLGLGRSAQSLVSQTGDKAFSYCLPPTASHTGFFTLGVPRVSSSRFAVTPMHRSTENPTYHVVILTAITVAGRRLSVPPSVFSNGSVMDSGTIVTRLPPTAYRALRAAFRAEMKMYPPAPPTSDFLDTCFNISGAVKLPSVGLVFERGATVEIDPSGIMFDDCLAFAPTVGDEPSIIGNMQQRTFEVLYDLGGQAVGFRRGAC